MVMNENTWMSQRSGARFFNVTFQLLAIVMLIGTIYVTFKIANLGWQFGIHLSKNFLAWLVFASGLVVSALLSAIGYGLGILCAIYDRQSYATYLAEADSSLAPTPGMSDFVLNWLSGANSGPAQKSKLPTASWTPPSVHTEAYQEKRSKHHGDKSVREWLTRERHFRQPRGD